MVEVLRCAQDRKPRVKQDTGYSVNQKPGPEYPQIANKHFSKNLFGFIFGAFIAALRQEDKTSVSESGRG